MLYADFLHDPFSYTSTEPPCVVVIMLIQSLKSALVWLVYSYVLFGDYPKFLALLLKQILWY